VCGDGTYCSAAQTCDSCQSSVCGVCDEIDTSTVTVFINTTGEHENPQLGAHVFSWPITTELEIDNSAYPTTWLVHHRPGEFWNPTTATPDQPSFRDGAAMIACWDSITNGGITCQTWEWYCPDYFTQRSFDWPVDRPVAHFFVSAIDEKRTAVRYYGTWPWNDPLPAWNQSTVGTNLLPVSCH